MQPELIFLFADVNIGYDTFGGENMNLEEFELMLKLIEKEIYHLASFAMEEEWIIAGFGALIVLRDYISRQLLDKDQFLPMMMDREADMPRS